MDLPIHNTYDFSWVIQRVLPGGTSEPYDLTGKDITIVIEQNGIRRLEIPEPGINENIVTFTWQGKDQHVTGAFRILLIENDGKDDMYELDSIEPFRLVRGRAEVRDRCNPSGSLSISTIDLLSAISVYPDQAIPATIARVAWVEGKLALCYTKTEVDNLLGQKVDKIPGKGLSEADFTETDKEKLSNISEGAQENVIEGVSVNGDSLEPDLNKKVNISVPTALKDLQDDATHRLVTDTEKSAWNEKYKKPAAGIPKGDLATTVQEAINAAGTALQPADIVTLTQKVTALESLISEDSNPTAAIDKFNEIVAFLANITNSETLSGIIAGINDAISAKYSKPAGGIPKTDLAEGVQTSLEKADTALQEHQDVSGFAKTSDLLSGELVPLLAENLESWKGRASDVTDTQTAEAATTGGETSINASVGAQLVAVVAKEHFAATQLISHGFNLLRRAVAVGAGWYIKVPALPFGVIRTALKPNGVLFTDSSHNNIRPAVRFKALGDGVPTSVNDGSACSYTDVEGYRFYTTTQPGYLIVSGIDRASVCAHIAWSGRYDDYIAIDDPDDAGSVITITPAINALHSYGLMLVVGSKADRFVRVSKTQARWYRQVERTSPAWTNEDNEDGTFTHSATITGMATDGAAEFFSTGARLTVVGTTVSYTDDNAESSNDYVVYELATEATGTVNLDTDLDVEDYSIITLEGATGSAYVSISYARGIPDSLRALIAGDLDGTYSALAGLLVELNERIAAIEEKIINGFEKIIVDDLTIRHSLDDFSTEGNANLQAAGAPDFIAAKIGQRIYDSVNKVFRTATDFTVAGWKLDTNS